MKIEKTRVGVLKQLREKLMAEFERKGARMRNEDEYMGFRFTAQCEGNGIGEAIRMLDTMLSDLENEPK